MEKEKQVIRGLALYSATKVVNGESFYCIRHSDVAHFASAVVKLFAIHDVSKSACLCDFSHRYWDKNGSKCLKCGKHFS